MGKVTVGAINYVAYSKITKRGGRVLLFLEVKYSELDIANAFLEKHI